MLGFRSIEEMVGRVDKLEINPDVLHYKSRGLDLTALLTPATSLNDNHSGVTKSFEQVCPVRVCVCARVYFIVAVQVLPRRPAGHVCVREIVWERTFAFAGLIAYMDSPSRVLLSAPFAMMSRVRFGVENAALFEEVSPLANNGIECCEPLPKL